MADNNSRLLAEVARSLLDMRDRLRSLEADETVKSEVTRRFIAATNAAKHDPATAKKALARLVDDLDSGRIGGRDPA